MIPGLSKTKVCLDLKAAAHGWLKSNVMVSLVVML